MSEGIVRRVIHRGAKFDLEMAEWAGPSGRLIRREVVRHPGAVIILPLLEGVGRPPRLVLIRNFRVPLGRELLELPAGTLGKGEAPAACAARELEEETGYRAGGAGAAGGAASLAPLARFYTSPGLSDELMHAFVARGLTHVGQKLEEDERVAPAVMDAAEALAMAEDGRLMDAKSMLVLFLARTAGVL
jgi:ADP-ribose pyrophosphatase